MALRDLMALKTSPESIAEAVHQRLVNLSESSRDETFERWVVHVTGVLRPTAARSPESLTSACSKLALTATSDWAADNGSAVTRFARALLTASPDRVSTVANQDLKSVITGREDRAQLGRLLQPIWVDLAAATCLATGVRESPSGHRFLLNTDNEDVAADYVERALQWSQDPITIRSADIVGEDPDELFAHLEQVVIDGCPEIRRDPTPENFAAWLAGPYGMNMVPIVFVRAVLPPDDMVALLDRLVDRFPGLRVLVLDGTALSREGRGLPATTIVEPALDRNVERNAEYYRGSLERFVEG